MSAVRLFFLHFLLLCFYFCWSSMQTSEHCFMKKQYIVDWILAIKILVSFSEEKIFFQCLKLIHEQILQSKEQATSTKPKTAVSLRVKIFMTTLSPTYNVLQIILLLMQVMINMSGLKVLSVIIWWNVVQGHSYYWGNCPLSLNFGVFTNLSTVTS